jgi:hypothetical protein
MEYNEEKEDDENILRFAKYSTFDDCNGKTKAYVAIEYELTNDLGQAIHDAQRIKSKACYRIRRNCYTQIAKKCRNS